MTDHEERFVAFYSAKPTEYEKEALIERARNLGLFTRDLRGDVRPTGRLCMHYGWNVYAFEADKSERARAYGNEVMGILPGFPVLQDVRKIKI